MAAIIECGAPVANKRYSGHGQEKLGLMPAAL
jgi:hypothetical protein